MGTIVTRKRADGKPSYLCQIAKKLGGKTVREARTFHDHKAAKAWIRQREAELDNPHSFKAATRQRIRLTMRSADTSPSMVVRSARPKLNA